MTLKIRAYPSGHCPQATPSTESNASMTTTGQTIPVDRTALTDGADNPVAEIMLSGLI
jgi:hypothetical protein